MAEPAIFRMPRLAPTAEQRRREQQYRRKNLRIAIRQLERAELYVAALESLDLDDREVDTTVRAIVEHIRSLGRYLSTRKSEA